MQAMTDSPAIKATNPTNTSTVDSQSAALGEPPAPGTRAMFRLDDWSLHR